MDEKALIVIPARMASTRFPNKPLAKISGIFLIERVWRIAKSLKYDVVIATDDLKLKSVAENFGAEVLMTSPLRQTGTDRVAEVAEKMAGYSIFFSLQGDAALTPPWVIESVLDAMLKDRSIEIATPAVKLEKDAFKEFAMEKKKGSSSGTSVVFDLQGKALYFSKALLPFSREEEAVCYRHIGLYGYRLHALRALARLPMSPLEKGEKLEQLRALENNIPIQVICVDYRGRTHGSVDRPEDVAILESIIAKEGELVCV